MGLQPRLFGFGYSSWICGDAWKKGGFGFDVEPHKDSIVFGLICAKENATEQEFRQQCLQAFTYQKLLILC